LTDSSSLSSVAGQSCVDPDLLQKSEPVFSTFIKFFTPWVLIFWITPSSQLSLGLTVFFLTDYKVLKGSLQ
jgi:hypothetical protein